MIIERDKLYRVEGYEMDEGNSILIENVRLLVNAPSIEQACQTAREYFGLSLNSIVTKCELVSG